MRRFIMSSLVHYWRTNLAVVAGVGIAIAVLSGALLVGKSVQSSLAQIYYQRLGVAELILTSDDFFRSRLADEFSPAANGIQPGQSCPLIYLQGSVTLERTGARLAQVNVYGIDDRFWRFHGWSGKKAPDARSAILGEPLALGLGAGPGDTILLRLDSSAGIPRESLYGRKEDIGKTLRLGCAEIIPPERLGEFAFQSSQGRVYSVFVSLGRLQKDLGQAGRANTILLGRNAAGQGYAGTREILRSRYLLEDLGITLREFSSKAAFSVESRRILLDDSIAGAAMETAAGLGWSASGIFSYLANTIRAGGKEIPYSVITAADLTAGALAQKHGIGGQGHGNSPGARDIILLNSWAAEELGPQIGDEVEIDYYAWLPEGRLATRSARFFFGGKIALGGDIDAALAPEFPGISGTKSIRDWDPPFPLDLGRIRPRDEEYWDRFRSTPKAFIELAKGQELWRTRFGQWTSVRVKLPEGHETESEIGKFKEQLRMRLDPEKSGFTLVDVKKRGAEASRGNTDFGEYFVYFSFFLIAAALLFSGLFFSLSMEQRMPELGTLRALGFSWPLIQRIFIVEGLILSAAGGLIGMGGSLAYGGIMVLGLRTWWSGAAGTERLSFYIDGQSLLTGAGAGVLTAIAMILWTARRLRRLSPRGMLAGYTEPPSRQKNRRWILFAVFGSCLAAAVAAISAAMLKLIPEETAFYSAGTLLLASLLALVALFLRSSSLNPVMGGGGRALLRLSLRNATHRPARSLVCIALVASATFIVVSVEAFRQDPGRISLERNSGTGGFAYVADTTLPVVQDPNSPGGREALGVPESEVPELAHAKFYPFRVRPGDDMSCLNLYAPQEPRILGAPHSFLAEGRFAFKEANRGTGKNENPWMLLEKPLAEGVIPTIGDANTLQYVLHLPIGSNLTVRRADGTPARLQIVAALQDSLLQSELVISEANFLKLFPQVEGYRFFLLDLPREQSDQIASSLRSRLSDFGITVESSRSRIAAYHRVENTYLSTFQSLGMLGLLLGTAGLTTVLLRNVLERRKELALMRAVGFDMRSLTRIIFLEHACLITVGLGCGALSALVSISPALLSRGMPFPVYLSAAALGAVLATGIAATYVATMSALRAPLLEALKSE